MNAPKALIYDCDGVLFDSHSANLAYYNHIFAEFGQPEVEPADIHRSHLCHTASSPVVLRTLMPPELAERALLYLETMDYRPFIPYMKPHEGVEAALRLLSARMPLAVATNRGKSIQPVLADFGYDGFFRTVICCRDVAMPKPQPDMLLLAAHRLGFEPGELLFVGDSELDYSAAKAAGVPFVGFAADFEGSDRVDSHAELATRLLNVLT